MTQASSSPASIPWHHRLEARVLLAVTLVVGVSLLAMLVAGRQVVTQSSLARAREDLLAARAAFTRLVDARVQFAARQTRLVTELPTVRALLQNHEARADPPTVNQTASDYCRKLQADFCVVSDPQGRMIGQANYVATGTATELGAVIDAARAGRSAAALATLSGGLFLIVGEPALFDEREILGAFAVGYRLDDAVAAEIASVAHCDVSFVCGDGALCGSSLPPRQREALEHLTQNEPESLGPLDASPTSRVIGDTPFVGGVYPLSLAQADGLTPPAPGAARLVLLQNWTSTEAAVGRVETALLWIGLATFLVALAGGLVFSRRMTRPLRDLADVANDVAGGNWTRRVPADGPAEARTMAEAFNRMTLTLSHWHREARTREEQLQDAYNRFRAVTNSANDAIVSVNRRGEIVFWNLRAQEVFGYQEAAALGQPLTLLMPERYRLNYAEEMAWLLTGESRWVGRSVELAGLRRDGSEVPVELSLSTWKAGQELFYTAVIRDITERKQAAETLRQREEQLRQAQKMEAVGRLAGGVAHDFNNLLTAILGYADLLLADLPAEGRLRSDAEEIQKAGRSAAALIRELLAFSRKQVLQPVVLDLNVVAEGTENLLRRLLGESVDLVLQLDKNLRNVRADRSQLEQVLVNLAVNARDAMPTGGRLTIQTSVRDLDGMTTDQGLPLAGRHVVLTVSDTGHGMSEETRSRIFEPFFTTKPVGKGTGLGLSTVYGIVSQSGGHIWVESALGKGTSFNVALPVVDAAATAEAAGDGRQPIAQGSELVLLVEDNDSVRSLAREALLRSGYRVLEARNGEEALSVGAAHLPHLALLVTDVVMPIMGGRELADQLMRWRPGLKVIFTSGYVDERVTGQGGKDWGAMFLQKPFTPATLGRAVREVLDMAPSVMGQ